MGWMKFVFLAVQNRTEQVSDSLVVRVDGCQPKGPRFDPRRGTERFHDSFNFVFYIVGECISCAADTHLATDLTCKTFDIS